MSRLAIIRALALPLIGLACPATAWAASAPATTEAQSSSSLAVARQVLEIAFPPARRPAMFAAAMNNVARQMEAAVLPQIADPGLRRLAQAKLETTPARIMPITERHIPALMDSYARAYAREFTFAELQQLLTFAQTPTGAHYLARSSSLLGDPDVAAANTAYLVDVQVVQKQVMAEMQREVQAYIAQHARRRTNKT